MEPYQERVMKEKKELGEKLFRLDDFIRSEAFDHISRSEQYLLILQYHAMAAYSRILNQRVMLLLGRSIKGESDGKKEEEVDSGRN